MIHNNKVYANADEKFVKGTIVYRNPDGLYHDEKMTEQPVYESELKDMFMAGLFVDPGDGHLCNAIAVYENKVYYVTTGVIEYSTAFADPTEE